MRPDGGDPAEPSRHAAFVLAVTGFALAQSSETLANIIGFFHLAGGRPATCVDFDVNSSGDITLRIAVDGEDASRSG